MPESRRALKARATRIVELLDGEYPGTAEQLCALDHDGAFQLLVATILSAQCTDERVNMVTPEVFARYPTPADLGEADATELEEIIKSTGFFRAKSQSLIGMGRAVAERFGGTVPSELADLVTLPGVGRKTANVVRSVAFHLPGLPVDTHVRRLSRRLGMTTNDDPEKIEADLCALVAEDEWGGLSLRLILHGRRVCIARRPRCGDCLLFALCPSALPPAAGVSSPAPASRAPRSPGRARRPASAD